MRLSIRRAREEDARSIVEVLNPLIQAGTYTVMDQQVSVEDQVDFIRNFPDQGVYHVAICQDSGQLLGLQDVAGRTLERRGIPVMGVRYG